MTAKINELPVLEGERVLRFLTDHCNKPEWTCGHEVGHRIGHHATIANCHYPSNLRRHQGSDALSPLGPN